MTPSVEQGQVNAREVLLLLLRARRGLLRLGVGAAILVALIVLVSPRWWRAEGSFVAQTTRLPSSLGALSGVASQLGFAVPGSDATYPPQFYVSLMRSRAILDQVIDHRLDTDSDESTPPRTLLDLLGHRSDKPEV